MFIGNIVFGLIQFLSSENLYCTFLLKSHDLSVARYKLSEGSSGWPQADRVSIPVFYLPIPSVSPGFLKWFPSILRIHLAPARCFLDFVLCKVAIWSFFVKLR